MQDKKRHHNSRQSLLYQGFLKASRPFFGHHFGHHTRQKPSKICVCFYGGITLGITAFLGGVNQIVTVAVDKRSERHEEAIQCK